MVFLQYYLYYVLSISSRSLFLMMMMMMNLVFAAGPNGLTLKLIHRDSLESPDSPLYPGNLTQLERTGRAFQRLKDREQKLSTWMKVRRNSSTTNSKGDDDLDALRPWVRNYDQNSYMVEIGIGAFTNVGGHPSEPPLIPIYYHFYFDTGSNLLWIQCDRTSTRTPINRTKYFLQDQQLYRGDYSHTFRLLPANSSNSICRKYNRAEGIFCGYGATYGDGAGSAGALAFEKLTVNAGNDRLEEIDGFVLGCGLRQNEPAFGQNNPGQNPVVGMLGLGGGEESFVRQLGDRAQMKFEYCLKPWNYGTPADTFLRFGSDAKIPRAARGQGIQTTRTLPIRGDTLYYVIMYGISIDGEQVVYPDDSVFQTRPDGSGGCIFDTGAEVTQFSSEVYDPFEEQLIRFFSTRYGLRRRRARRSGFDLCFDKPDGFKLYPTITFHFRGMNIGEIVNFEIKPRISFSLGSNIFCLTIRRTSLIPSFSVIVGALQQANHRILHDLGAGTVSWVNDLCAANP